MGIIHEDVVEKGVNNTKVREMSGEGSGGGGEGRGEEGREGKGREGR